MGVVSALGRLFGREAETSTSKTVAKQRLRLVLVHDRLDVSETIMNSLREDLINTIGKYMEIDKEALDVSLSREEDGVALMANIPVINVKRQTDPTLFETRVLPIIKPPIRPNFKPKSKRNQ